MSELNEPKRVLVVDDDPCILSMLKIVLEKRGYAVLAFETPLGALEELKSKSIRVILVDLKMFEMNGIEFLTKAKKVRPSVSVIMLTGTTDLATVEMAFKCGVFDYLGKPFDLEKMCYVVEQAYNYTGVH